MSVLHRVFLSMLVFAALPACAANLVNNPGFESGVQGMVPTGWTKWWASWSGGYYATTETVAAYSGSYGLREYITGSASFGVYQEVSVIPNNAYKLNGMWRAVTAGSQNWFEIILLDGPWNIDQADSAPGVFNNVVAGWDAHPSFGHPAPASWAWEPFSATYGNCVSPYIKNGVRTASGNKMTIVLKIGCASLTKPTVYFDNISLTPVPKTTVGLPSTSITRTGPVSFSVDFTESVTGFESPSDVEVITTGTAAAGTIIVEPVTSASYRVTLSDIAGDGTIAVKIKENAAQNADGNGNLESAVSQAVQVLENDGSIAEIKGKSDGTLVKLAGKLLSLKRTGFGYIQEPDRTCGIRIEGAISGSVNDAILLVGTLRKPTDSEPYIQISSIASNGSVPIRPLGANNRAISSGMLDGLLVRTWGKVKSIGANSYVLCDGSDNEGIAVITLGSPEVGVGDFVTVTGVIGVVNGSRVVYSQSSN